MKNINKYVGLFLENSLEESPGRGEKILLKEIYNEYKLFSLTRQVKPILYKNFRLELMEIFANLKSSIKIIKMHNTYYVLNVKLIGKTVIELSKVLNLNVAEK